MPICVAGMRAAAKDIYVWRLFGPLADCWMNEAVRSPRFDTIGIDGGHQFSSCRR